MLLVSRALQYNPAASPCTRCTGQFEACAGLDSRNILSTMDTSQSDFHTMSLPWGCPGDIGLLWRNFPCCTFYHCQFPRQSLSPSLEVSTSSQSAEPYFVLDCFVLSPLYEVISLAVTHYQSRSLVALRLSLIPQAPNIKPPTCLILPPHTSTVPLYINSSPKASNTPNNL